MVRRNKRVNAILLTHIIIFIIFIIIIITRAVVEQVLTINNMLLAELEKAIAEWPTAKLGPPFKKIAPFMKAYSVYVNNHDECTEVLKLIENNDKSMQKFKEFLSEVYKNPKTERHKFDSFAILPVQRIPRYRMLLSVSLRKLCNFFTTFHRNY